MGKLFASDVKKLAIAEDNEFFRNVCVKVLENTGKYQVVFCASNGLELIMELHNQQVDAVIIDIKMPIMNGTDTIKHIQKNYQKTKIIVYSTYYSEDVKQEYLNSGIHAYLCKEQGFENIKQTLNEILY